MSDSDLGNVGVQREVHSYERVQAFDAPDPTWVAILSCGHEAKLTAEPTHIGRARGGRYMDCPACTALSKAQS